MCGKNNENWLAVDKVIAKISRLAFLAHPVGPVEIFQNGRHHFIYPEVALFEVQTPKTITRPRTRSGSCHVLVVI